PLDQPDGDAMNDERIVALRATPEADVTASVALIAVASQRLAEARGLSDVRLVIEAAGVAVDAAPRAAKRAQGHRMAVEVVEAANQAANDAAAVRIEAQARAGELLTEMRERGERERRGGDRAKSQAVTLLDLGVSRMEASRWHQVAAVPAEQRA